MRERILASCLLVIVAGSARAQNYKTALGLRLSSNDALVNNAISVKHFLSTSVALEGLFSFNPVAIGALAEVHHPLSSTPGLRWLFGGGAFVYFEDGVGVGAQGMLGLDYKFTGVPINLSLDWKPELDLTNEFSFEPAAVGLSLRFVLK